MRYLDNPNLPENSVNVVAVSAEAKIVIDNLESAKIAVVPVDLCSNLPKGIASHADLQLIHLGKNNILVSSCSNRCKNMLEAIGFSVNECENVLGGVYPDDCIINSAIIGNKIITNPNAMDTKLSEFVNSKNMEIIGVKQGYAKCSSMIICEDAIITADSGIEEAAKDHEIEVLKIRNDNIFLYGYDNGFIGGCGGMIEKHLLGTSGDFKTLKDYNNIKDFLRNRNIYMENLGGREVMDIGGILPLCENN